MFPEWIVKARVAIAFPSTASRLGATVTVTWPGTSVPRHAARESRTATGPFGCPAKLVYEVPLAAAAGVVEKFKAAGTVRLAESTRDPQSPDGKYARARLDVTISTPDRIVADDGLWPPVRRGLSYSASVLLTSVTWVVFGLCVVLPWAVVGYVGYRVVRRAARKSPTA